MRKLALALVMLASACASVEAPPSTNEIAGFVEMAADGSLVVKDPKSNILRTWHPKDPSYATARRYWTAGLGGLRRGQSKPLRCTDGSLIKDLDGSVVQMKLIGYEFRILAQYRPGDPGYKEASKGLQYGASKPVYVACS